MTENTENLGSSLEGDINLQVVYDIPLQISAVLGKAEMKVNQLVKLTRGAVIELDRKVGDAIDIYVNDRLVAKGEIVLVDNKIGITLTELINKE
ncbi:Flagellar motor switch protein FliN [Candidatus Jidaibacter acanthamoeba]|uniref:Flagellar motor switch protein FliN n=1 Tax=Candidatus Jidaibacter acanthamoebae TaxID=86105 RepID=A0A0C1QNC8_9RICK|nr:flagellar motor switch protein FliN [Candidatus Jidaibacter acanthamoeba]KIE05528.1 Flagellar motor switch protein FliN [Candidatus Jidaibacter acanthamoeba]